MTATPQVDIPTRIEAASSPVKGVLTLDLSPTVGNELPCWTPGSHIDVVTPVGVRQYSLCSDPKNRSRYTIAIRNTEHDGGVSSYLHRHATVDSVVTIRGPQNRFELQPAQRYVFIAGGIGITPILPMLTDAHENDIDWQLIYIGRSRRTMAFIDQLERFSDRVHIHASDESPRTRIESLLRTTGADTFVYCCGPESLIADTELYCTDNGITFRTERFTPRDTSGAVDTEFEVELAQSGTRLTIAAHESLLDKLLTAGADILTSCEEGTCGTCETPVLAGTPDHRDSILTPEEQQANDRMLVCVSRCSSRRLVLDL